MSCTRDRRFFAFLLSLIVAQLMALTPQLVAAESILQVLPTRVVLAGNKRSMTVTLINRGDSDGSYRMFFRNIRADENGQFTEVETPVEGELFADNMVRFSPRRITVPARSKQSIRVLARKPQGLEDGEYRSHLVFRKLPSQNSVLEQANEDDGIGFSLRPIVEVTIPVIVRHGAINAELSLSDASLIDTGEGKEIQFRINREGQRSLYGDVDVWWIDSSGNRSNLAMARGISVYTPNSHRIFSLPLETDPGTLAPGKIMLEYREDPAYGGDQQASLEKAI